MENIVNEMFYEGEKRFLRFNIFLSAYMAKAAMHSSFAVEAVLFLTFRVVTHLKFFLKIGTKLPLYRLVTTSTHSNPYF